MSTVTRNVSARMIMNCHKQITLLNFKVNKVNEFCRFVFFFVHVVISNTHYTSIFINLITFVELYFDGNPLGWDRKMCPMDKPGNSYAGLGIDTFLHKKKEIIMFLFE